MNAPELSPTTCNCLALRQASRHVSQFYDQALAPSGVRTTQYSILHRLTADGPRTVNELADQLVMDPSTLTHNLRPLLKGNLIALQVGADRRQRVVAITTDGRMTYRRARGMWLRAQAEFESTFGESDAGRLRALLFGVVGLGLGRVERRTTSAKDKTKANESPVAKKRSGRPAKAPSTRTRAPRKS